MVLTFLFFYLQVLQTTKLLTKRDKEVKNITGEAQYLIPPFYRRDINHARSEGCRRDEIKTARDGYAPNVSEKQDGKVLMTEDAQGLQILTDSR